MKIHYENTCIIRDAKLDFEKGKLIAITGESNNGKSSILYSFVDAFSNSPNFKKWINKQALEENPNAVAKISFIDDKGNWYQAEAGTGHINYRANDIKYEKPGRKSIFELINGQIPGLLYDPEDSRIIMNVQDEDSGLFPIDRSDTQIFKTYERLLSLSCTEDVLRTIKLDNDELDFKIADASSSIQKQNEQIAKIDALFDKVSLDKVDALLLQLQEYNDAIVKLSALYDKTYKDAVYIEACKKINMSIFNDLDLAKVTRSFSNLSRAINITKYLSLVNSIKDTEDLDINKIKSTLESIVKAQSIMKEIELLSKEIKADSDKLEEIESTLKDIKVCPYCNRPMEN